MTNAQAEERPFLTEMEREPEATDAQKPVWREHTFSITRSLFRIDGMAHRVLEVLGLVGLRAKSVADRGAKDYAEENDLERGIRLGRSMVPPNIGGVNGGSKALTILVALNTALLVGVGGWLLATVSRHDREIAVVECQINPACSQAVVRGRQ
jgi:hypothetical protein